MWQRVQAKAVIEKLKLLVAVLCVAGGIVAFHYLGEKPLTLGTFFTRCQLSSSNSIFTST